ncbi:MAG: Clp protease N-terminal domain-containing protein [Acidimicrobiales bacterium]
MFERFSREAQRIVVRSLVEARLLGHDAIGSEHVLLALTASAPSPPQASGDPSPCAALAAQGVTLDRARNAVAVAAADAPPSTPWDGGPYTPHAKQAFEHAVGEALGFGHDYVTGGDLLLGILQLHEGTGVRALESLGVDLDRLEKEVEDALESQEAPDPPPDRRPPMSGGQTLGIGQPDASDGDGAKAAGPAARGLACSFCGRGLGIADRFVAGEAALICDSCVRAAGRIIDEPL